MTTQEKFAMFLKLTELAPKKGSAGIRWNREGSRYEVTADVGEIGRKYAKVWEAESADEAVEVERIINV